MSIASVVPITIFGLRQNLRDPFSYLDDTSLIYLAGANVIVYSSSSSSQKLIPALSKDARLTAISVTKEKHYVAVAETTSNSILVQILGLPTFRRRKSINVSEAYPAVNRTPKDIVGISFSSDSKYMAVITGDLFLSYWIWEKSRLTAKILVSNDHIEYKFVTVLVNPIDENLLSVYGRGLIRLYRLSEKELIPIPLELPIQESEVHSFSWLSAIRFTIGGCGNLYLFENFLFKNVVELIPAEPSSSSESHSTNKMDQGVNCTLLTSRMLITACKTSIYFFDRSSQDQHELLKLKTFITINEIKVRSLAINTSEEQLLLVAEDCSCFTLGISPMEIINNESSKPIPCLPTFHELPITGMDVSIRKPLIATCSADKSIRLWNFLTLTCELCKFFTEEPLSVSIHPSGYFLLAGFSDKLRLMNILLDELRTIREFPIRSSRECCFSNGGHMLAASQGSVICIYNVWTYELVTTLKGHNGKILSLRWSNGDVCLISCGSDGAVYIWNLATMKRENEFIMKGVTFASAVDLNETTYAAGSDRTIKVITESMLVKDIVMPVECTQLAISHTGKMFFAGTQLGNICAIRFPIPKEALDAEKDELCQEHVVHSGPVIKLRITFDDKYMVSAGEDGCLCLFRISELDTGSSRSSSKQSEWTYTQEQLVTKSDHLERISNINDLKTRLEEVNMEYDYQLRLKTMNQQDSLKELTTEKTKIAESLKINLVVQRGEKEKTEARNRGLYSALVVANQNEYRALENKYSQELMNEYETFQNTQTSLRRKQEAWEFEVKEFEKNKKDAINSLTSHYERLCISRHKELVKLQEDAASQRRENSEHIKQQQEDLDEEIINFQKQYEVLMKAEREVNFRLKGENGIMKKKFLVLTKEIEDNKLEMVKLTENENRLRKIMSILEREVDGFRNEMIERDKMIQEQEKRVYELKKSNQELEKYKFVLDYKIKDLKRQIEPREEKISDLKERIKEINLKLGSLREKEEGMKETQKQLETSLEQCIQNKIKEHQRLNSLKQLVKQFQTDLTLTMDYIQEPAVLKRLGLNLRNKFCKNMAPTKQQELGAGEIELQNQQAVLQKNIQKLKKESTQNTKKFRQEHFEWVQGNKKLLTEIKELQKIKASLPPLSTSYTYQVSVSASGTQ